MLYKLTDFIYDAGGFHFQLDTENIMHIYEKELKHKEDILINFPITYYGFIT